MALGPACPGCGARVPFGRTQWKRGTPFACAGCGARLVMPRTYLPLLMLGAYALLRGELDSSAGRVTLLLVLFGTALAADWAMARPRRAPAAD